MGRNIPLRRPTAVDEKLFPNVSCRVVRSNWGSSLVIKREITSSCCRQLSATCLRDAHLSVAISSRRRSVPYYHSVSNQILDSGWQTEAQLFLYLVGSLRVSSVLLTRLVRIAHLSILTRSYRGDQLFNSSEKRLAGMLLSLSHFDSAWVAHD